MVACARCTRATDPNLLRDDLENVPQPGWVGPNYAATRLLLVGQNPGTPKTFASVDPPYTAALRVVRDARSPESFDRLVNVMRPLLPQWPVSRHFPLAEAGLNPNRRLAEACVAAHFKTWLRELAPQAVIFLGVQASTAGGAAVAQTGIPFAVMNRQRSLSTAERIANREQVVRFVQQHCRAG